MKQANTAPSQPNLLWLTLIPSLGGFLFGYDTAVINGAIAPLTKHFGLSALEVGWATGSALIGCIIGSAIAGEIGFRLGRKYTMIWAAALFTVSAAGSAIPSSLQEFVVYRIIGGVGVGLASYAVPIYIAEIAPPAQRGWLVSMYQMAVVIGISLVFFVNYFIGQQGDEAWQVAYGWRWMMASEMLPALAFFLLLFFIPRSPRWLMLHDRQTEALQVLEQIRPADIAAMELAQIAQSIAQERHHRSSLLSPGVPWILFIGVMMSVLQQVTGINVILYYGTVIFKNMGAGLDTALFQTTLIGVVNLAFTIVALYTIDSLGRKPLVIIGALGMCVGISGLGVCIYVGYFGLGALAAVLLFIGAFAMSMGPVVWVQLSEIFPNRVRSQAMAIGVSAQWLANYAVTQTFPLMMESPMLKEAFRGAFPFWLYGAFCIVTIFFVYFCVPETKGKTLEEMEAVFGLKEAS